jgi:hypothetical protein
MILHGTTCKCGESEVVCCEELGAKHDTYWTWHDQETLVYDDA